MVVHLTSKARLLIPFGFGVDCQTYHMMDGDSTHPSSNSVLRQCSCQSELFFAVAKSSEALQSNSLTQSNNLEAIFSKLMHVMQSIEFQNQSVNTEISNPIQCQLHYNG